MLPRGIVLMRITFHKNDAQFQKIFHKGDLKMEFPI